MHKQALFIILIIGGVLGLSLAAKAADRSVIGFKTVEDFRPIGEGRAWSFFSEGKTFGQLTSVVKGTTRIDGESALIILEKLEIDFSQIGIPRKVTTDGELYLATAGHYLGHDIQIGDGQTVESFRMVRKGEVLEGQSTRAGEEIEHATPYSSDLFAWEANFVDQLEIILALRDISVGDHIDNSVFVPHSMYPTRIVGDVVTFMWQEIYKGYVDSIFVIELSQPGNYQLFLTADRRLVRTSNLDQDFRIYQDVVRTPPRRDDSQTVAPIQSPGFSIRGAFFKSPHYVAYLLLAVLGILFFTRSGFNWNFAYLSFFGGLTAYLLVPLLQLPSQQWVIAELVVPGITSGGSLYIWGMLPPIVAGLGQGGFLIGTLLLLGRWRPNLDHRGLVVGAFCGAGFGMLEAWHMIGFAITPLVTWELLERGSMVLFHVAGGAVLGKYVAEKSKDNLWLWLPVVMGVNALLRYLPVFAQSQLFTGEVLHFVMVFIVLVFLLLVAMQLKRRTPRDGVSNRH